MADIGRGFIVLLVLLTEPGTTHAQVALRNIEVSTPRPFGYVIGDVVEQHVRLELNPPFRLEETSLPKPGV